MNGDQNIAVDDVVAPPLEDVQPIVVPPAFYRDDDPPEPPEGDPHWREFPLFDAMKTPRLLIAAIAMGVVFVTLVHLAVLFFI